MNDQSIEDNVVVMHCKEGTALKRVGGDVLFKSLKCFIWKHLGFVNDLQSWWHASELPFLQSQSQLFSDSSEKEDKLWPGCDMLSSFHT